MQPGFPVRLIMAVAITLVVAIVLVAVLMATDTALSIWQRLNQLAPWASALYIALLAVIASLTAWFSWRLISGSKKRRRQSTTTPPLDRATLEQRLHQLERQGGATAAVRSELTELDRRQNEPVLYLAMFGEISSGKTSLINALLPGAHEQTSVVGGTTTATRYFDWQPQSGLSIRLVDLPGFDQADAAHLAHQSRQEASRAHLVIYVCDGDINRTQYQQLQVLMTLGKPLIIALNKADWYSPRERQQITHRLREQLGADAVWDLVPVQAGGTHSVTVIDAQGHEQQQTRPRPVQVEPLAQCIRNHLQQTQQQLRQGQGQSALMLAAQQLAQSEQAYRTQRAEELVRQYGRRAVIGALAAVAPGADIVIQGALGTALVRSLCELYEVPVREVDIDRFLERASGKLKRNTAIVLAVAGNALKAFPGLGTVAGGLVHAVAYGMIFDSLGRALAQSLAQHAQWQPAAAVAAFEEQLIGHLETPAKYLVRTAVEQLKQPQQRAPKRH